jgi:hypothetical protein
MTKAADDRSGGRQRSRRHNIHHRRRVAAAALAATTTADAMMEARAMAATKAVRTVIRILDGRRPSATGGRTTLIVL